MKNDKKYENLADYLSDHLYMNNSLDYSFLKNFPEFIYKGTGFRVIFSENNPDLKTFENQSFSKTKAGAKEFVFNSENYDKDFCLEKNIYIYECLIEGFDLQLALSYFKETKGLTEKTIDRFHDEEEVIAFSYSHLRLLDLKDL